MELSDQMQELFPVKQKWIDEGRGNQFLKIREKIIEFFGAIRDGETSARICEEGCDAIQVIWTYMSIMHEEELINKEMVLRDHKVKMLLKE